jgi:hypothetical protein
MTGVPTVVGSPKSGGKVTKAFVSLPQFGGKVTKAFVSLPQNCDKVTKAVASLPQLGGKVTKAFVSLPQLGGKVTKAFVSLSQLGGRVAKEVAMFPQFGGRFATVLHVVAIRRRTQKKPHQDKNLATATKKYNTSASVGNSGWCTDKCLKIWDLPTPPPPPLTFFHICVRGHDSSLLSRSRGKKADKRCLGKNNSFLICLKFACKDRTFKSDKQIFFKKMQKKYFIHELHECHECFI